jgi:hypothetical protein
MVSLRVRGLGVNECVAVSGNIEDLTEESGGDDSVLAGSGNVGLSSEIALIVLRSHAAERSFGSYLYLARRLFFLPPSPFFHFPHHLA